MYLQYYMFLPHGGTTPNRPGAPHYQGFTITFRHTTLIRTPLDEWPSRHRDLCLTTRNKRDTHARGGIRTRNPTKRERSHTQDLIARPLGSAKYYPYGEEMKQRIVSNCSSSAVVYRFGYIRLLNVAEEIIYVYLLRDASILSRDIWPQGSAQASRITNQPTRTGDRRLVEIESERREGDVGDRFPISAWRY